MPSGVEYRIRDELTNWGNLRAIGDSTFSKTSMFVPVFGYFILFNDNFVEYLRLTIEICPADGCQLGWRLFLIYFGLCLIAVGAAIFTARCPAIVKRYSTSREFFATSQLFYAHHHNLKWLLDNIEEMKGEAYDDGLKLLDLTARDAVLGANQTHTLSGPMAAYYNLKNEARPLSRLVCAIFYGLGALLLALPTLYTFYEVSIVAFRRFV